MNKIFQAKFTGIMALDEPLEEGKSYSVALEQCEVKRIDTRKLAEDDAERTTFSLENIGRCNILTEKEGRPLLIKAKSKKSTPSQIWRLIVEGRDDYKKTMSKMIDHADEVLDFIINL